MRQSLNVSISKAMMKAFLLKKMGAEDTKLKFLSLLFTDGKRKKAAGKNWMNIK